MYETHLIKFFVINSRMRQISTIIFIVKVFTVVGGLLSGFPCGCISHVAEK